MKHAIDSLLQLDPLANIIIMGDFNDEPRDKSLQILTNPSASTKKICNLSPQMGAVNDMGTIKHRGAWSIFDQVLASEAPADGAERAHRAGWGYGNIHGTIFDRTRPGISRLPSLQDLPGAELPQWL